MEQERRLAWGAANCMEFMRPKDLRMSFQETEVDSNRCLIEDCKVTTFSSVNAK